MINWKDITSYSKDDIKRAPGVLEVVVGEFSIRIHKHICFPDNWFLTCNKLGIERKDLKTNDFKVAEISAINYLIIELDKYSKFQNELVNINKESV